eukprot:13971507-Alexandrium_andersonii.AAC.1
MWPSLGCADPSCVLFDFVGLIALSAYLDLKRSCGDGEHVQPSLPKRFNALAQSRQAHVLSDWQLCTQGSRLQSTPRTV